MTDAEHDDNDRVVITQTLLRLSEVFVYRIPPLKSSGGHRAEDWDLAKPLQTCSLTVDRQNDACIVRLLSAKPKEGGPPGATEESLFAQCQLELVGDKKIEHWIEGVTDSSRYFVLRISDESSGRQATIGVGFRERDDASNFRMALQDYERSLQREREAAAMHTAYQNQDDDNNSNDATPSGNLTLKEGEKIHVNLKGTSTILKDRTTAAAASSSGSDTALPLLKKPPPPPTTQLSNIKISLAEIQDLPATPSARLDDSEQGSECAVASVASVASLSDDEEWNDFEGSTEIP